MKTHTALSFTPVCGLILLSLAVAPLSAAPTVTFGAPWHGSAVSGKDQGVTISYASEGAKVVAIDLTIDGQKMLLPGGSATHTKVLAKPELAGSQQFKWDTTLFADGVRVLGTKVYDEAGGVGTASVTVYVSNKDAGRDTTPPSVAITKPRPGEIVSGPVEVAIDARDNKLLGYVFLFIDDTIKMMKNYGPFNYLWNTKTAENGAHTLLAKATDASENQGASPPVTVIVNNEGGLTRAPERSAFREADAPPVAVTEPGPARGPEPSPGAITDPGTPATATPATPPVGSTPTTPTPAVGGGSSTPTPAVSAPAGPPVSPGVRPPAASAMSGGTGATLPKSTGPATSGPSVGATAEPPAIPPTTTNITPDSALEPSATQPHIARAATAGNTAAPSVANTAGGRTDTPTGQSLTAPRTGIGATAVGGGPAALPKRGPAATATLGAPVESAPNTSAGTANLDSDPQLVRVDRSGSPLVTPAPAVPGAGGDSATRLPRRASATNNSLPLIARADRPVPGVGSSRPERSDQPLLSRTSAVTVAAGPRPLLAAVQPDETRDAPLASRTAIEQPPLRSRSTTASTVLIARAAATPGVATPAPSALAPQAAQVPDTVESARLLVARVDLPVTQLRATAARLPSHAVPIATSARVLLAALLEQAQPADTVAVGRSASALVRPTHSSVGRVEPTTVTAGFAATPTHVRSHNRPLAAPPRFALALDAGSRQPATARPTGVWARGEQKLSRAALVLNMAPVSFPDHPVAFGGSSVSLHPVSAVPHVRGAAMDVPRADVVRTVRNTYVIQPGDTLTGIASRFGVSAVDIALTNQVKDRNMIRSGHKLIIPDRSLQVFYDSQPIKLDVRPFAMAGVPMAPFRAIFEHSGGKVLWRPEVKRVEAKNEVHSVKLQIGSREALVDGEAVLMDLAALIRQSRTMVPTSLFSEVLDVEVQFDPSTGHIMIASK